jgi:hypothetical protein
MGWSTGVMEHWVKRTLEWWIGGAIGRQQSGVLKYWSGGLFIAIGCVTFLDHQVINPISLLPFLFQALDQF